MILAVGSKVADSYEPIAAAIMPSAVEAGLATMPEQILLLAAEEPKRNICFKFIKK